MGALQAQARTVDLGFRSSARQRARPTQWVLLTSRRLPTSVVKPIVDIDQLLTCAVGTKGTPEIRHPVGQSRKWSGSMPGTVAPMRMRERRTTMTQCTLFSAHWTRSCSDRRLRRRDRRSRRIRRQVDDFIDWASRRSRP